MMFVPFFRMFKSLINQTPLRTLIFKNIPPKTIYLKWYSQTVTSNVVKKKKILNITEEPTQDEIVKKAARLISEYPSPDSIKWEELIQKLKELKIRNTSSIILQACLRLKNFETGMNYFYYIVKDGQDLTPLQLIFFIKLFSCRKDQILKHESVIKHIYSNIKVYMESPIVQHYIIDLISETPSCYYDFIKNFSEEEFKFMPGKHLLAIKAFEFKNPELAFDIMNSFKININEIFKNYINYLCQMAIENKFSPDMITTFIKFCEDKNFVFNCRNFLSDISTLVNTLNKHDKDHVWMFKKCHINCNSICSTCNTKLHEKHIPQSEFNSLKEAFFPQAGLTNHSAFLNSTDVEIQKFFKFLKNSEPYDIVFDGLNLMHVKPTRPDLSQLLKYFLDKDLRVLIIGRIHARNHIYRQACLQKSKYKDKCQYFFTENLSDDDLFMLYATIHGGLGTKLVSGDFLNKYGARFNNDLQNVFFKWKVKHQFVIYRNKLYPPLPTLGLSQLTTNENGNKFIWHMSYIPEVSNDTPVNRSIILKWICLQAEKKSSVTSNQNGELKEKYGIINNAN